MDEATRQGVSEELDPRGAAIREISEKYSSRMAKELKPVDLGSDFEEDPEELEEEPKEEPEGKEEKPEEEKEPEPEPEKDAEEAKPTESEEKFVTLKVDGKDVTVPLSKVTEAGIRSLQKESAADKRLEEATQLRRELEQLKAQIAKPAQVEPQKPQFRGPQEIRAEIEKVERQLYDGVNTEKDWKDLQAKKQDLMDEYFDSRRKYETMLERDRKAEELRERSHNELVTKVSAKYPAYQDMMFQRGPDGEIAVDPSTGLNALNPDFEAWLKTKRRRYAVAALIGTDPDDAIEVLDEYVASVNSTGKPKIDDSIAARKVEKQKIDTIEGGSKKATEKSADKDKPMSDDEWIRNERKRRNRRHADL